MRVVIDRRLSVANIARRYNLSRTTAWRAKSRGYVRRPDPPEVDAAADPRAFYALAAAAAIRVVGRDRADFDDAVQAAVVALWLRSGSPDFARRGFRFAVAFNAARGELKRLRREPPSIVCETVSGPRPLKAARTPETNREFWSRVRAVCTREEWLALWSWAQRRAPLPEGLLSSVQERVYRCCL